MIILHLNNCDDLSVKDAIDALLRERGYSVSHSELDSINFMTAEKLEAATDALVDGPVEEPTVSAAPEQGTSPPNEMEITLAMPDVPEEPVKADEPEAHIEPAAREHITGEIAIISLSSSCLVPFSYDEQYPVSELRVQHLSNDGEHALFTYCGMTFRYPIDRSLPPNDSGFGIRAVIAIGSNPANSNYNTSVHFKLVNDDECRVIFGSDHYELLKSLKGDVTDDQVPAQ